MGMAIETTFTLVALITTDEKGNIVLASGSSAQGTFAPTLKFSGDMAGDDMQCTARNATVPADFRVSGTVDWQARELDVRLSAVPVVLPLAWKCSENPPQTRSNPHADLVGTIKVASTKFPVGGQALPAVQILTRGVLFGNGVATDEANYLYTVTPHKIQ